MTRPLLDVAPGQPITAAWANEILAELRRLRRTSPGGGMQLSTSEAGQELSRMPEGLLWLFACESPTPLGATADGVPYYEARRARVNTSDHYEPQPELLRRLYDPSRVHVPQTSAGPGDLVYATFNRETERWEIVGPKPRPRWAQAYENWTRDPSVTSYAHTVRCHPIDTLDGVPDTSISLTIHLPAPAKNGPFLPALAVGHPNVVAGDAIAYEQTASGDLVCVSAYLDAPIGAVRWFARLGVSPPGWGLMDGIENDFGHGGSGLVLVGAFARGAATPGGTGGAATHTHDDHADITGDDAAHTHPQNQTTTTVQSGAGAAVVASANFDTGAGSAHHHTIGPLVHNSVSNLPPYVDLLPLERLDNSL